MLAIHQNIREEKIGNHIKISFCTLLLHSEIDELTQNDYENSFHCLNLNDNKR
jgi:hypothetical protein